MRPNSLSTVLTTTGVVAAIFVLAGCNKAQTPADQNAASASMAASANNAADTTTNTVASANPAVAGAEDATAAAVGAAAAPAAAATSSGFITAAANSDMYEIAAARIARQKATDPAVKAFAARMIHDHTLSTEGLKKAIATGAVTASLPADMDERRKGLIDNLEKAAPADFDKTYIDQQVAAHNEAASLFKGFADHGDNDALKTFATKTTPTIQDHLAMAKQIRESLK
jgi:putative membrane protein